MIPPKYWSPTRKLMVLGAMAGGKLVEDTATGNPLTFITDKAKPLKSLLIPFTPQQEGTGDPSPSNIRSILPWDGLTVFGGGANLVNDAEITYNRAQKIDGVYENTETDTRTQFLCAVQLYDKNKTFIKNVSDGYASIGRKSVTFNVDASNCAYICLRHNGAQRNLIELFMPFIYPLGSYTLSFDVLGNDPKTVGGIKVKNIQLESGSSATAYEPYKPITDTDIVFPSHVYGGEHEAVSGELKSKYLDFKFKWSDCTPNRIIGDYVERIYSHDVTCDSSSGGRGKCNVAPLLWTQAGMTRFYVNYENFIICLPADTPENTEIEICALARTPQEIQLTPEQITAIKGSNTIWSDADGSMTAVYLKKG